MTERSQLARPGPHPAVAHCGWQYGPHKASGFFGIGAFVVDSSFYRALKETAHKAFRVAGWDQEEEFKGRYLFSSTKGDTNVDVNTRIELVRTIVQATTANKNARAMFCLAFDHEGRTEENYLTLLGRALRKCPRPTNKKGDKSLAAVFYDRTDIASPHPSEAEQAEVFEKTVEQIHAEKLRTIREILERMKKVTAGGQ